MAPLWQELREGTFAVFYVMTEQSAQNVKGSIWELLRYSIIYFLDVGQVLRALYRNEFGWSSSVQSVMENFDFLSFVSNLVSMTIQNLYVLNPVSFVLSTFDGFLNSSV